MGSRWLEHLVLRADHQAEAALETEDATAGADVHVVDPALAKDPGATDVVAVVAVAAVDEDVALGHEGSRLVDGLLGDVTRGDHDPGGPRWASAATNSSRVVAPVAPSASSIFTASGLTS